jgi:UPF0716 protein FxsA
MLLRLVLLFTLVPLVELVLLLILAERIGWQYTLGIVLGTGVLGALLARWQGGQCWRRVHEELAAGRLPGDPLLDGLMILLAGVLLVTPGVLTDAVGFTLLLPPARAVLRRRLKQRIQARMHFGPPPGWRGPAPGWPAESEEPRPRDVIIDTRVIDDRGKEADDAQ